MGVSQSLELNVISPENSSTIPLGVGGVFTGEFVKVMDWTSVFVIVDSDVGPAFNGFQLQWSVDGLTELPRLRQSFSQFEPFVDGRVRAPYFRVVYTNGVVFQNFFLLVTLLRRGPGAGSILPLSLDVDEDADAQVVQAMLMAPRLDLPSDIVRPRASPDPYLYVIHPPPRNILITQGITATTAFSPELDFFGIFGGTRRFFTVFNNTTRGNLYIKLDGVASIGPFGYDYKVPPQGTWTMPITWIPFSGTVFGIWDFAALGGEAHVVEAF